MILLCDENISPRVAGALSEQGFNVRSFKSLGWLGTSDLEWLPLVGEIDDSVVLTCDRMILEDPDEYASIINSNAGIVFLTSGELPVSILVRLVSSSWTQLDELQTNTPYPFIRFLTPEGLLLDEYNRQSL